MRENKSNNKGNKITISNEIKKNKEANIRGERKWKEINNVYEQFNYEKKRRLVTRGFLNENKNPHGPTSEMIAQVGIKKVVIIIPTYVPTE
jgi:hypothetical protein